jgi:hypothetical protein
MVILNDFHLLVPSAILDALFEVSAPLVWKGVLRTAEFGRFLAYDDDFRAFPGTRASRFAEWNSGYGKSGCDPRRQLHAFIGRVASALRVATF